MVRLSWLLKISLKLRLPLQFLALYQILSNQSLECSQRPAYKLVAENIPKIGWIEFDKVLKIVKAIAALTIF